MRDIPGCKWLDQWTELAQRYGNNIYTLMNRTNHTVCSKSIMLILLLAYITITIGLYYYYFWLILLLVLMSEQCKEASDPLHLKKYILFVI